MRRRIQLSRGRIRQYAGRALRALPDQYREAADNVLVVVENRPRRSDYKGSRGSPDRDDDSQLLGVYRGTPLTERAGYQLVTPDVIAIFRKPLLTMCRSRRDACAEVRLTVLHEFGHFLGLSESEVQHL